ncbi:MAG: dihydroneopterin triphosphate 2'-epimerase [Shewanellaceae bacterium]|nr:dihydroneopterin triphosphate 2'-epimerase [Shewanellaceae bacterium]
MLENIALIQIKNLRLRTFIGIKQEEIMNKQDVVLNISIQYLYAGADINESILDALNYRTIAKKIIHFVENKRFSLLEKMTHEVLNLISDHQEVVHATVEIDKPHALRFADSVSLQVSYQKPGYQDV